MRKTRPDVVRVTQQPDDDPPPLACPICGTSLLYLHTSYRGSKLPDRSDRYHCTLHGLFDYRYRTGRLREAS